MKNLEKTIEELQRQLDEVKQQLSKPAFEVGKWYKFKDFPNTLLVWNGGEETYVFWRGDYDTDWSFGIDLIEDAVPATDKEVEEALIKEAIKRGFKEGVHIDSLRGYGKCGFADTGETCLSDGIFVYKGTCVFKDGKWASIIKDEPIKIGGYEVFFLRELAV